MINRTQQPALVAINEIDFVAPEKHIISDKVNLYHMRDVPNETARFDLYFNGGKSRSEKGIAALVNGLLLSGTEDKSSIEINEEINALGGFLESGISQENAVISIYCLRENLTAIFRTLINAIQEVSFIPEEVEQLIADRKQKYLINQEKVNYLAQRGFQEQLFASNPSYAATQQLEDFDSITREELIQFHREHYLNGLTKVVVVGNVGEAEINTIIEDVSPMVISDSHVFDGELKNTTGYTHIEKKDALQSAIRVGRTMFNKDHEDYLDFLVLNTIVGDYFGSRLMSNIREDKGYTYGIGSMLAELNETGYFMIATEVGSDVRDAALKEIRFEIERLQNELVSDEELSLVKNYMLGQLLKSADGPYAMTDLFLSVELHEKDLEFYNDAIHALHEITPERIQALAKKYLQWDDMTIITAG